jgi:hypothetical protein
MEDALSMPTLLFERIDDEGILFSGNKLGLTTFKYAHF